MKEYLPYIIQLLLGSGFLTGLYVLLKVRVEAGQITVTAAEGAVIVQTGVIDSLKAELERLEKKITKLENEKNEEIKNLQEENTALRRRVKELEKLGGV